MICIAKTDPKPDCLFAFTGHPFGELGELKGTGGKRRARPAESSG